MQLDALRRNATMFAAAGLAAFAVATFLQSRPLLASPPPPPPLVNPMRLATVTLPEYTVPVPPAPAITGNVTITLTSSGGPFCLQGLTISPGTSTLDPVGDVWINVDRIGGAGMSHPYLTIYDGTSQGSAPQDIILSYGNAICVSHSIEFQARQLSHTSSPGQPISLNGRAIYLSASNVTVTAS